VRISEGNVPYAVDRRIRRHRSDRQADTQPHCDVLD
jgi:hypothetical protein